MKLPSNCTDYRHNKTLQEKNQSPNSSLQNFSECQTLSSTGNTSQDNSSSDAYVPLSSTRESHKDHKVENRSKQQTKIKCSRCRCWKNEKEFINQGDSTRIMRTCNSCRRRNKVSAHQEVKNTVVRRSFPHVENNTIKEKVVKLPIVEPKVEPVVPKQIAPQIIPQIPSSGIHMIPSTEVQPSSSLPVPNPLVYSNQSYPYYPLPQSYYNQPTYIPSSSYSYPSYVMQGYSSFPPTSSSFNYMTYVPSARDSSCLNKPISSEPFQYSPPGSKSDVFDFSVSSGDSTLSSDRKRSYSEYASSSSLMSSAVPVSNLEILAALSRKELISLMQKQDVSLGLQSQEKRMNI